MRLDSSLSDRRRGRRGRLVLGLLVLAGIGVAAAGAFLVGPAPTVTLHPEPRLVGRSTPVDLTVEEPSRGLSRVLVELIQNGAAEVVVDQRFEALPGWKPIGERTKRWNWTFDLGKDAHPALREGAATLRVTAERAPAWLRHGAPTVVARELEVKLTPPRLTVLSSRHYVAQGGSEAVVYRVSEDSVRDGVVAGDLFSPGSPLPGGGAGERVALFAVPYDLDDPAEIRLVATDAAGNRRSAEFVDRFFPQPPAHDDIQITERFLSRVVPSILAGAPELDDKGSLIENFLQINRDLRKANGASLRQLAASTKPEFLWRLPFLALPGGQVMSSFADRRTYFFEGREVDRQVHLGFDLASIRHADVPSANRGVVVLARELGIYGNAVVVDHGMGLMSLYAHLSRIAVQEGDTVDRGQVLGQSGETGLAGGDHLHFCFLLHGEPVRPVEWWDTHWIEDRLKLKLGPALPFGETKPELD